MNAITIYRKRSLAVVHRFYYFQLSGEAAWSRIFCIWRECLKNCASQGMNYINFDRGEIGFSKEIEEKYGTKTTLEN